MHFRDLNLIPSILSAVEAEGYVSPTPVQAAAIPPILEGRDVLGCAQTGTGKTAAFALPTLQRLAGGRPAGGRPVRALILTPTRELALQIGESFAAYGKSLDLRHTVIFGGVGEGPQKASLRAGVDIVVATPGRLIDLLGQKALTLQHIEIFTLDEADRMLDMGFVHDVKRICALLPSRRQTLLFSATMPAEIRSLADGLLRQPVKVEVAPVSSTAEKIEQNVYFVPKEGKAGLLRHILADEAVSRVLVFTRTKHGADRLQRNLERFGIPAEAIHGNKSQGARVRSLSAFKDGSSRVLVATDLAARGIDVDDISHVVNYDLPNEPETYVHRIGRTGRAGRAGVSFSFCAPDDTGYLRDIERLIRMRIQVAPTPAEDELLAPEPREARPRERDSSRNREDGRGRDGQGGFRGAGNGRDGGSRNGSGRHVRRGDALPGSGEGSQGRRDSGHRRASTGHNPAGRGREGRLENASGGMPKDTRPSHLRGQERDGRGGKRSGPSKNRGERTYVREYYSNDR